MGELESLAGYQEHLEKDLLDVAGELYKASTAGYPPINRVWVEEAVIKLQSILERENELARTSSAVSF